MKRILFMAVLLSVASTVKAMDLLVTVQGGEFPSDQPGKISISFSCVTSDGKDVGGAAFVDLNASVNQTNDAIEAEAKAAHSQTYGTTFTAQDKVFIIGGRTR